MDAYAESRMNPRWTHTTERSGYYFCRSENHWQNS